MKITFQTAKSPVYYYIIDVQVEQPPKKDFRSARDIFEEVQKDEL